LLDDDALVQALIEDPASAKLEAPDRAMLAYVEKLTRTPWEMQREDVSALRRQGFEDDAVLEICQVASYFAFVNRMADGLGVELEEIHSKPK